MKTFFSIILAVTVSLGTVQAKHGGHGKHGGYHGGHKFSRGTWGTYRNWSGRNWGGDRFVIGGFGYPYWGLGYPYGYYGSSYYPYNYYGYGYEYGNYGYGYGSLGYDYRYGYPSGGYSGSYYGGTGHGNDHPTHSRVAELQRRLARAGYYSGAIDGIMGPATREAIHAWERDHGYTNKHNETPPSDASNSQASGSPVPSPPRQREVRMAKAASVANQQKTELPYGTAVPGKPGLVTSPFEPDGGYVNVTGFPRGSEVEDPYTGKIFLTP